MWPTRQLTDLLGIDVPIIQAPMAGASGSALANAVSRTGALGSLPCAMLTVDAARAEVQRVRASSNGPLNLNFFCHEPTALTSADEARWLDQLQPYYRALDITTSAAPGGPSREPFGAAMLELIEEVAPEVVSFHFGLPGAALLERVVASGAKVLSSATTVAEARWLAARGVDAVIAQGAEAGGHRGVFLDGAITSQPGTLALVPQVVDAIDVPVIAAGGIADGRGIAAAFALGAAGVQIGTAYLFTPEATVSALHRQALDGVTDDATALTNLFSGRPARGIVNRLMREVGPMNAEAAPFPHAGTALAPLKKIAEADGRADFSSLWAGQAAALARTDEARPGAGELTERLARDALEQLHHLAGGRDHRVHPDR